jgi:hypothetical protein
MMLSFCACLSPNPFFSIRMPVTLDYSLPWGPHFTLINSAKSLFRSGHMLRYLG